MRVSAGHFRIPDRSGPRSENGEPPPVTHSGTTHPDLIRHYQAKLEEHGRTTERNIRFTVLLV
jgi:hypothetical protein